MKKRSLGDVFAVVTLAAAIGLILTVARAPLGTAKPSQHEASAASTAGPAPKTAGESFKNIQVLKNIPADELIPSMQFIATSLGVRCDYCHVEGDFAKDDKQPKRTARNMMRMMFAINQENFHGEREVTCFTCHHGSEHPVGVPVIAEAGTAAAENMPGGEGMTSGGTPLTGDQLVDKYVEALGGAEALQKITSRVEKGTLSGFGPSALPVVVYAKAPNQRVSVVETPRGKVTTAYNGQTGWMSGMGGSVRTMSSIDLPAARLNADFHFPLDIKQDFTHLRAIRPEKVNGREAYAVIAFKHGQPPVKLCFDPQSGLLVRLEQYQETPLGANPIQTDFSDYREEGGVKIPFQWTIARPQGSFTIKVSSVQQNVPIDDSKFAEPASSAAAGQ